MFFWIILCSSEQGLICRFILMLLTALQFWRDSLYPILDWIVAAWQFLWQNFWQQETWFAHIVPSR